ncbi:glycosyltransferase [Eubacterium limosum]|uniref:glycosyltransferase n=1 Tax=Eubacterium limosum TaxID=1736 RepID=UPI00106380F2|nr:glycosyltransferase [Eubacterium limosum]
MNNQKFSVLMSVYKNDNPNFFKQALDSIISQTVVPSEIILVVDGPIPEEIKKIISIYKTSIVTPIFLKENVGLGNALKIGMQHCNYDLIARMDSDDISVHDRFEKQLQAFLNHPKLSIVGGIIDEFENDPDKPICKRVLPTEDIQIKKFMKHRCPFNHQTVMFKKQDVLNAGGYQDWHYSEDYYLWIRMYESGCQFKNVDQVLVHMRVGEEMYGRRGGRLYFRSQKKLMKYMKNIGIINKIEYIQNILIRFMTQCLIPSYIRSILYKRLIRKK